MTAGSGEVGVMTAFPLEIWKRIVSVPGTALASTMARRREPGFRSSRVFVTVNTAGARRSSSASSRGRTDDRRRSSLRLGLDRFHQGKRMTANLSSRGGEGLRVCLYEFNTGERGGVGARG